MTMKIMQICFTPIINSAGGVEKVYCNMSNHFCKEHEITDVCCDGIDGKPFYELDQSVKFLNLTGGEELKVPFPIKLQNEFARIIKQSGAKIEFPRERYVRKQINEKLKGYIGEIIPDVVICYDLRSMVAIAECGYDLNKVIVMFHSDAINILESLSKTQEEILRKVKCVQVLMKSYLETMNTFGYKNVVHIGNIVPEYEDDVSVNKEKLIIHVGRIDKIQKRQHLLIEAFAKIAHKYHDWRLECWGGDSRPKDYEDKLNGLIKKYGLENQVFLMGKTNDVPSKLRKASIFAFPSEYEGFPLALTEAMSIGLPCVGLKSCIAVSELINHGSNGILSGNDIDDLTNALETLIDDCDLRHSCGMQAKEDMKKYTEEYIFTKWTELLDNLSSRSK